MSGAGRPPGGKKSGGRQKGTPNKDTKDIRAMFKSLVENNLSGLQKDIDDLKGESRVKYTLEMAKFCIPTLKSVDFVGDTKPTERPKLVFVKKGEAVIVEEVNVFWPTEEQIKSIPFYNGDIPM